MRGLYVHIPFCVKKCDYCDFYSLPGRLNYLPAYVEAILAEARAYAGLSFDTLYLGGGTPSLLGPDMLTDLVNGLRKAFDLSHVVEFTMEANPDSLTLPFLHAAWAMGVNRLSIGVQSLTDAELRRVGRVHSGAQALEAIHLARQHGPPDLSCDVILGLPGQDWVSLRATLSALVNLDVRHLSVYCLTIEPYTPLGQCVPADLPADDAQAELYENTCRLLGKAGFEHYEISNFAGPGYACRHNLNYWRGGEYLGLGPAAASHLQGRRFKNRADLDAYLRNPTGVTESAELLTGESKAAEEAMLRLRLLQEGLNLEGLVNHFGDASTRNLQIRLDSLVARGLVEQQGGRYRLAAGCALVSNSILLEVLPD